MKPMSPIRGTFCEARITQVGPAPHPKIKAAYKEDRTAWSYCDVCQHVQMLEIEWRDDVAVVHWQDNENRFNAASVQRWHALLDELEQRRDRYAMVITGQGKFFSNGLDLDSFAANPETAAAVLDDVHRLFGRLLVYPAYVVAALNGHTFAAGAMLTCCVDYRIMREDRGYWSLPEADLGLALTEPMFAAVTSRLNTATAAEAMNSARRYSATEALECGIVDEIASETSLLDRAVAKAASVAGKDQSVIGTHKRMLFGAAANVCGHTL